MGEGHLARQSPQLVPHSLTVEGGETKQFHFTGEAVGTSRLRGSHSTSAAPGAVFLPGGGAPSFGPPLPLTGREWDEGWRLQRPRLGDGVPRGQGPGWRLERHPGTVPHLKKISYVPHQHLELGWGPDPSQPTLLHPPWPILTLDIKENRNPGT